MPVIQRQGYKGVKCAGTERNARTRMLRLDSSDIATEIMAMATTATIFENTYGVMIATMRAKRGRRGGYMYDFIRVSLMQAGCSRRTALLFPSSM